jgi:hypothetical protein
VRFQNESVSGALCRRDHAGQSKSQLLLTQRNVPIAPDDQMIEHLNIEQLARFDDLTRDPDVFRGRRGIAGRVTNDRPASAAEAQHFRHFYNHFT